MFKFYKSLIYKFCCHYGNDRLNFAILVDSYPLSRYHQRLKSHYFLAFYIFFLLCHFCISSYRGKNDSKFWVEEHQKSVSLNWIWKIFFPAPLLLFGLDAMLKASVYLWGFLLFIFQPTADFILSMTFCRKAILQFIFTLVFLVLGLQAALFFFP